MPTSYKAEVHVEGSWSANSYRFATATEAHASGAELLSRWFVPDAHRVAESEDPVNARFDIETGRNVLIERGCAAIAA